MTEKELLIENIRMINQFLESKEVRDFNKINSYMLPIGTKVWLDYMKIKMQIDSVIEAKKQSEIALLLKYNTIIVDQERP